jgi:hypothetical protein
LAAFRDSEKVADFLSIGEKEQPQNRNSTSRIWQERDKLSWGKKRFQSEA